MTRSCYSDDYGSDYPGQLELFRANVRRSMQSKAGQARLRELRGALQAMPVKALAQETLVDADTGAVCALGQWAVTQCGGDLTAAAQLFPANADDEDTAAVLKPKGWPRLVVLDVVYENDRDPQWKQETPEQRYARVLAWVESHLDGSYRE